MPAFSLFAPMPGLPWYLVPIWPLIYLRIQRLRAWFKANGGPGSQMLWAVTNHGRVDLVYLSDAMCGKAAHPWVPITLSRCFKTALAEAMPPPLRVQGIRRGLFQLLSGKLSEIPAFGRSTDTWARSRTHDPEPAPEKQQQTRQRLHRRRRRSDLSRHDPLVRRDRLQDKPAAQDLRAARRIIQDSCLTACHAFFRLIEPDYGDVALPAEPAHHGRPR